jgi:hypothetical protein
MNPSVKEKNNIDNNKMTFNNMNQIHHEKLKKVDNCVDFVRVKKVSL